MTQQDVITQWVPVGLSADLDPQTAYRAVIGTQDLAVWRGQDSKARVWENRCPHRGMRLSFGFVRENLLTCLYHGWAFDGKGSCAKIPAHPDLVPPRSITVNRFACVESAGMIWTAPGDTQIAAPAYSGRWTGCRSLEVRSSPDQVVAALSGEADALTGFTIISVRTAENTAENTVQVNVEENYGVLALLIGMQLVSPGQVMLHASVLWSDQPGDMKPVNRMLRHLRMTLESNV